MDKDSTPSWCTFLDHLKMTIVEEGTTGLQHYLLIKNTEKGSSK
jgi:hypothetical protein